MGQHIQFPLKITEKNRYLSSPSAGKEAGRVMGKLVRCLATLGLIRCLRKVVKLSFSTGSSVLQVWVSLSHSRSVSQ